MIEEAYLNGDHFLLLRKTSHIRVRLQKRHFDARFIIYIDGYATEGHSKKRNRIGGNRRRLSELHDHPYKATTQSSYYLVIRRRESDNA